MRRQNEAAGRRTLRVGERGEALHAAGRRHAGEAAFIQRWQVHKKRNVVDHLPRNIKPTSKASSTPTRWQTTPTPSERWSVCIAS